MRVELFLDEGEEYPQFFNVWKMDPKTGRADLTTHRNYIDVMKARDIRRKIDDENIKLEMENAELRKFGRDMLRIYFMPSIDSKKREDELLERAIKLGVAEGNDELATIEKGE